MALGAAVVLLLAAAVFRSRNRKAIFGALFFLIALLPVSQIIPLGWSMVSDRYTYLPMIGICFLVAAGISRLQTVPPRGRALLVAVAAIVLVAFGALTFGRCRVWKDSLTLWTDAVSHHPSSRAYYGLGFEYGKARDRQMAARAFHLAAVQDSANINWHRGRGVSGTKLGNLFPVMVDADIGLGDLLLDAGRFEEAVACYREAIALDSLNPLAWCRLGSLYLERNMPAGAAEVCERALVSVPASTEIMNILCQAYLQQGRLREGVEAMKRRW